MPIINGELYPSRFYAIIMVSYSYNGLAIYMRFPYKLNLLNESDGIWALDKI